MYRFRPFALSLPVAFALLPQTAHAADFGFVRWPGYFDLPILLTAVLTAVAVIVFKRQMPEEAKDFVSVPKEDRTMLLKASAVTMLASFALCMILVFVGMGLARA